MSFVFPFLSFGFIVRFIVAFVIIAYLYSCNKNDRDIKRGFTALVVLGGITVVAGIVLVIVFMVTGGTLAFLGNALPNVNFYY